MNSASMSSSMPDDSFCFTPIARIRSCYPDRFGIPRQSGLVSSAIAQIEFENTQDNRLSLRGIDAFSHLWVLFVFHRQSYRTWKPLVHPPRLGGNQSVGLYATRSPNRFNPIGMSAVKLSHVEMKRDAIALHISGGDFLDQTPVLDLKPYIVYADAIPSADSAWATTPHPILSVEWSESAERSLTDYPAAAELKQLISETIALDPRPGYERGPEGKAGAQWHMRIEQFEISWGVTNGVAVITQIRSVFG